MRANHLAPIAEVARARQNLASCVTVTCVPRPKIYVRYLRYRYPVVAAALTVDWARSKTIFHWLVQICEIKQILWQGNSVNRYLVAQTELIADGAGAKSEKV